MAAGEAPRPGLGRLARWRVKQAVEEAEWLTGLQLCVYLGRTGEVDPRRRAEELFAEAGLDARPAVLVLVAPDHRRVEVLTAPEARSRVPDSAAAAAVEEMTARFAAGDPAGALVSGIRSLAAAAGPGRPPPTGPDLPDLLG